MSSYVSFISGPTAAAPTSRCRCRWASTDRATCTWCCSTTVARPCAATRTFKPRCSACAAGACSNVCPTYQQVGGHAMRPHLHRTHRPVAHVVPITAWRTWPGRSRCAPAAAPAPPVCPRGNSDSRVDPGGAHYASRGRRGRKEPAQVTGAARCSPDPRGVRKGPAVPHSEFPARKGWRAGCPRSPAARAVPAAARGGASLPLDRLPNLIVRGWRGGPGRLLPRLPHRLARRRRPGKRPVRVLGAGAAVAPGRPSSPAAGCRPSTPATASRPCAWPSRPSKPSKRSGRRHRRQHVHQLPGRHPRRLSAAACRRAGVAGSEHEAAASPAWSISPLTSEEHDARTTTCLRRSRAGVVTVHDACQSRHGLGLGDRHAPAARSGGL